MKDEGHGVRWKRGRYSRQMGRHVQDAKERARGLAYKFVSLIVSIAHAIEQEFLMNRVDFSCKNSTVVII